MGEGIEIEMDTKILRFGRIATYFPARGFGFIYQRTGSEKLVSWFFHVKSCSFEPITDTEVQFNIAPGPKGLMAVNVDLANTPEVRDLLATFSEGGQ